MTINETIESYTKEQYEKLYVELFSLSQLIQHIGLQDTINVRAKVIRKLESYDIYKINNCSDDAIISTTLSSTSYGQICNQLDLINCSINIKCIRVRQQKLHCDLSHLYKHNSKLIEPPTIKPVVQDGYKICNCCKQLLSNQLFRKNKDIPGGFHYNCKSCSNIKHNKRLKTHVFQQQRMKYTSKTRRDYNAVITQRIKTYLGCMACGENSHHCVLEYHHMNDDKDMNIGQQHSRSINVLFNEIKKCICLCANCHRKVHHNILNVDHLPIISADVIDHVLSIENIDPTYTLAESINTHWIYNKHLDVQMKIPFDKVDEYINNGYILGTRFDYKKQVES